MIHSKINEHVAACYFFLKNLFDKNLDLERCKQSYFLLRTIVLFTDFSQSMTQSAGTLASLIVSF